MTTEPGYRRSVEAALISSRGGGVVLAVGAGGLVGLLLYMLIKNLGGRAEEARGMLPPVHPRDVKRLTFVMTQPTEPEAPMGFRLRDEPSTKIFSLEELIARVKDGGRSDVALKFAGNVLQGSTAAALGSIRQAGIEAWEEETGAGARVSGNARGEYGSVVHPWGRP